MLTLYGGNQPLDPGDGSTGFALPAAVLAIVIIGALVTGSFLAASEEGRVGGESRVSAAAFYVAERGLDDTLATWTVGDYAPIDEGMTKVLDPVSVDGGTGWAQYVISVRGLGNHNWLIRSRSEMLARGRYTGVGRELGIVVRGMDLDIPTGGALQVVGGLATAGNAEIDGTDARPWDICPLDTRDRAGALVRDRNAIDQRGSSTIVGDPPVAVDVTMTSEGLLAWGELNFDLLASMADKVYPESDPVGPAPSVLNGRCSTADRNNWGSSDPNHPCFDYYPIIHMKAPGQTTITQGEGQGILLVEGDLQASGDFEFHGIVVVKGRFITSGDPSKRPQVIGVVLVANGDERDRGSHSVGNSLVRFSSCAVNRARERSLRAVPLGHRSWMDLTAAGISG